MNLTIKLISESIYSFSANNILRSAPEVLMAPDVFNEVVEVYDEFFGYRKFIDKDLPEGHVRIVGQTRHGEAKALYKVKGF